MEQASANLPCIKCESARWHIACTGSKSLQSWRQIGHLATALNRRIWRTQLSCSPPATARAASEWTPKLAAPARAPQSLARRHPVHCRQARPLACSLVGRDTPVNVGWEHCRPSLSSSLAWAARSPMHWSLTSRLCGHALHDGPSGAPFRGSRRATSRRRAAPAFPTLSLAAASLAQIRSMLIPYSSSDTATHCPSRTSPTSNPWRHLCFCAHCAPTAALCPTAAVSPLQNSH